MTEVDPIYPPREDTELLLPFAEVPRATRLLEIGAGNGLASLRAARLGARVVATDRNPHALRRLRTLATEERLDLDAVRTDLARGLGRFDRILANPPYLPTRIEERDPDRWHNLALDGGPGGTATTERIVEDLPLHLEPAASAFLLVSSVQDPAGIQRIFERWRARGGREDLVASRQLEGELLEVRRLTLGPRTTD